jgi:hypothetical protein
MPVRSGSGRSSQSPHPDQRTRLRSSSLPHDFNRAALSPMPARFDAAVVACIPPDSNCR